MVDLFGFTLLSVPLIGAYAMFALGISAIYRASRVLNLAHGAMAMVPAYVFYLLVGSLGFPRFVALPIAIAAGAFLGVGVEWLFVRRLRGQGVTAQTVGTVAVTGLLVALTARIWGSESVLSPKVFPEGAVDILGNKISFGDLGLFGVGVVASLGMFAFFRFTQYGLAMRGAAQNRTAAMLMGIDPDRAASVAWAIGGGLAAVAGILLSAVTVLDPYTLSLQVLPAFVAALIGGLESLVGALAGAAVVGLAFGLVPALGQLPVIGPIMRSTGASQLVLTIVALVAMMARGRRIVGGEDIGDRLAVGQTFKAMSAGRYVNTTIVAIAGLVVFPWVVPGSMLGTGLKALQFSLVAISLVALIGWVGQISLAQATFVGLGAFVTALIGRDFGIGFPFSALFGAAAGLVAAVILGAVALRVRGLYLAVATLIFAWMGQEYLFRASWLGVSGGSSRLPNQIIGTPGAIPSFDLTTRRVLYYVALAIVAAVVIASANLRDTRTGRAFFAVRGSEMAAASLGIDVTRLKLVAFAFSGALAGLAGTVVALDQRVVVPEQFFFTASLQFLAMAVVGGLTSLGGAIAAGLLFAGLDEVFFRVEWLAGWLEVVSAGLLAFVLLVYPGGLAAAPSGVRRLLARNRLSANLVEDGFGTLITPIRRGVGVAIHGVRQVIQVAARPLLRATEEREIHHRLDADFDWMAITERESGGLAVPQAQRAPKWVGRRPSASGGHGALVGNNGQLARSPRPQTGADPLPAARNLRKPHIEAQNVTVRFGGLTAVDDASLAVYDREIVGLIGPNGAGKTTLFNAILGLNDPSTGLIRIHDQDVAGLGPHQRARLGVARTFQVVQLFSELSVSDNLLVATHMHNDSGMLSNMVASRQTLESEVECRLRVDRIIELLRLQDIRDARVTDLPFGLLRMVEMGRALVTGAPILMLDEAASGLNDAETDRLIGVVRDVRDLGVSVLLIEHDIRMVTGVSDYMYCLDRGRLIAEGTPDEVKRHPDVVTAYLGADSDDDQAEVGV